jgi:Alw26I/Eco31I/Esp3I family type II restriction m6 adenine DNA methyltransferase
MDIRDLSKSLFSKYSNYEQIVDYLNICIGRSIPSSNLVILDEFNSNLNMDEIVELQGYLYEYSLSEGTDFDKKKQRDLGIYFTGRILSNLLTKEIMKNINYEKVPLFLEPSAGMGAFIFAYIRLMFSEIDNESKNIEFSKQDVLDSIYYVEKDSITSKKLFDLLNQYVKVKYSEKLSFRSANKFSGDAIYDSLNNREENLLVRFNILDGFDIVVTNPPYRLLKATQNDSNELRSEIEKLKNMIKNKKALKNVNGLNNVYKLFVSNILFEWLTPNGIAGLLIPRSLMTDHQSSDLRKKILTSAKLGQIYDIPENSAFFPGIGQAFTLFSFSKNEATKEVQILQFNKDGSLNSLNESTVRPVTFYENLNSDLSIIPLSDSDAEFLQALSKYPRTKDCPQIVNLRGELDISLDKQFISVEESKYDFVQGVDIDLFSLKKTRRYVRADFLPRPKGRWIEHERIACQQISNFSQERRLKWALIPSFHVLGNSCNFIAVDQDSIFQDKDPVLNTYLLAVFNSFFMNKWFSLLSSNNHVSNSEIANMPLMIPELSKQSEIDFIVRKLLIKYSKELHTELEIKLCAIFNLQEFALNLKWNRE